MKRPVRSCLFILFAVLPGLCAAQNWNLFGAAKDIVSAATVSEQDILAAAQRAVLQKDSAERVAAEDGPHARRLRALTSAHAGEDGLALNFKAYQSAAPSAFATADGSIRLTTGLMDLLDDDELRAVIGHHVGHVKLGHAMGAMRTVYMSAAARKLAAGAAGTQGYGAMMASRELGQMLEQALRSQMSQAQERAADEYAIAFLDRHRYRSGALESADRKLARHGGRHGMRGPHGGTAPPARGLQLKEGM